MHDIEDSQMICEISSKHRGFIVIFFTMFNGQIDILPILLTKEYSLQVGEGFFFPVDTDHISFYECISQEELI